MSVPTENGNTERETLWGGHRGYSALFPENTLPAFAAAFEHGAEAVEYDVQLSADGVAVVVHDTALRRTTGDRRAVFEVAAEELAALDAASFRRFPDPPLRAGVPRLEQVFEAFPGRVHDLEIKAPDVPAPPGYADALVAAAVEALAAAREAGRIAAESFATSFELGYLDRAMELDARLPLGALVGSRAEWEAAQLWRPARPPAVLAMAFPLVRRLWPAVAAGRAPMPSLPPPFEGARLWFWSLRSRSACRAALAFAPRGLLVDDLSWRASTDAGAG